MRPSHTPMCTKVDCPPCPRNPGICPTTAAVHGRLILEGNLFPCRTVRPTKKRRTVENGMPVFAINKPMDNGHNGDMAVCLMTVDWLGIPTRVRGRPQPAGLQRKFFNTARQRVWRIHCQARSIFSRAEGEDLTQEAIGLQMTNRDSFKLE